MGNAYEQKVLFWLREMLLEHDPEIGAGQKRIIIDEVRLEPRASEGNEAVIFFREAGRPRCVFGFRMPAREGIIEGASQEQRKVWDDPEGTGPQVDAEMIVGMVHERIEAIDMGLPPDCAADTITWV